VPGGVAPPRHRSEVHCSARPHRRSAPRQTPRASLAPCLPTLPRYRLEGVKPGTSYEVRLSYPASVSGIQPLRPAPINLSPPYRQTACGTCMQQHARAGGDAAVALGCASPWRLQQRGSPAPLPPCPRAPFHRSLPRSTLSGRARAQAEAGPAAATAGAGPGTRAAAVAASFGGGGKHGGCLTWKRLCFRPIARACP
jgi:hypothetical protein